MNGKLKNLKDYPLVSVGVPVYNEGKYIAATLQSIADQGYQNMEVLISDNASTDNTWEIIQRFIANDKRFKVVRQKENQGATYNFNYVLEEAHGEYFIWAGGHDLWGPNMITSCVDELEQDQTLVLCVPQTKWINDTGLIIKSIQEHINTRSARSQASRALMMYQQMDRCSAIYGLHRRDILLQTLPWPHVIGPDFIGLMRIAALGNIITNSSVWWCRRQNRKESSLEKVERQIDALGITGIAVKYPYIYSRLTVIKEFFKMIGTFKEKITLIMYVIAKLFLRSGQRQLIIKELFRGTLSFRSPRD